MITTDEFKEVLDNAALIRKELKELPPCEMTVTEIATLIVTMETIKIMRREALRGMAPSRVNIGPG